MRLPLRSFAALVLAVGVVTCSDTPHAPVRSTPGVAHLALSPVFSPSAAAVYAQRGAFAGVNFDHVRIVITRPPSEVLKDTTIVFDPTSPARAIDLTISVPVVGEFLDAEMAYMNNGAVVYRGRVRVQSYSANQPVPQGQTLVLSYVGPGSRAARVAVTPKTVNIVAPGGANFTAAVFDSSNTAITDVPITWSVSDPSVATIHASTGALVATGKRGTVTVTATTPTNLSDNGSAVVSLPPSAIAVVGGSGQTGRAGTTLPQPGVVQVTASDGIGVGGVTVNFAAPTGGAVGSATVTTDENGRASTTLTLGGALGSQGFAAVAAGFTTSISATATPGDPATIAAMSGGGQSDTVRRALQSPFVAKVADRFGNAVSGVNVNWARTSGSGSLGGAASTTNADGLASMTYTLGATAGAEVVTASVAGVSAGATFSATALPPGPSSITIASGNNQTARIGQSLTLSVKVSDDQGNALAGQNVNWSATNGTIPAATTTDAQGVATNTLTLGSTAGSATATATVGTGSAAKSVSFSATVQSGIVAKMVFRVQPTTSPVLTPLSPSIEVELQDAGGNRTAAANRVTIALGANPGQATLGGTLTKTSSNGIAVFDDLTIDHAGDGYTLVASSGGVSNITSATFDVGGQAGLRLVLPSEHPTSATSGLRLAGGLTVSVRDAEGASVTTPRQVTATFSAGSAQNNVVTTNSDGVASFQNLILTGNGQGTLTFSSPGVQSASFTITIRPGSIIFADSAGGPLPGPPGTVTTAAGQMPLSLPLIRVRDENGNGFAGVPVSYSFSRGATSVASGTVNSGENGDITLDLLGVLPQNLQTAGNYVLTATRTAFTGSPLTLNITVQPGVPSRYAVTAATTTPAPGALDLISAQLSDQYGNAVATPTPRVVSWSSGGPGTFSAPTSNTNTQGVATVTYTVPNTPNTTVNVTATDATQSTGTVQLIIGASNQASSLSLETVPLTIVNDVEWNPQPVVRLRNLAGDPVLLAGVPVTLTIYDPYEGSDRAPGRRAPTGNPSRLQQMRGTLVGGSATTDPSGIATFSGVKFTGGMQGILMMFEATLPGGGMLTAIHSDVEMMPGASFALAHWTSDGDAVAINSVQETMVALVDVSGNQTSGPDVLVTFTPGSGSGTVDPTSVMTGDGIATTNWTMPSSPITATLTASATLGGAPKSVTFSKTVLTSVPAEIANVSALLVTTPVNTPISPSSYPRVRVLDQQGGPIPNAQVTFSPSGVCGLTPLTLTTDSNGEAGLTSGNFSFPVTAGASCQVHAMLVSGQVAPTLFTLIAAPAGMKTWTGASNRDWTLAANWLPSNVPTASDQVFIPAFPVTAAALLTGPVTLAGLTAEAQASGTLELFSNTLTITGNLSAGNGAITYSLSGPGKVVLNATGEATLAGYVAAPVQIGPDSPSCSGNYKATESFHTFSVRINCPLELVGNIMYTISGSLIVQNQGRLIMMQGAPFLSTTSDATFQGASESGFLTAGTLSINGNLTIADGAAFAQGPNQSLLITGGNRTLSLLSGTTPLSLGQLQLQSGAGVTMNVPVAASASALAVSGTSTFTVGAATNLTVGPTVSFFTNSSVTTVSGSLNFTGGVNFQNTSQVVGSGTMSVVRSSCNRNATATVNVTGNAFTASSAQCAGQFP